MKTTWLVVLTISLFVACGPTPPMLPTDSGAMDAAVEATDSGSPDSGAPDSGAPDAGAPDAGPPDSGTPDAGPGCPSGQTLTPKGCRACTETPGLFRAQTLTIAGQTRSYLLSVPSSYTCAKPMPVVLDFHGALGGNTPAEEYYTLDGARAASERHGFILVRPRSTTILNNGVNWHYWDATAQDLANNLAFADALLDRVAATYSVDAERTYALGFSNGTQIALRLWAQPQPRVKGIALVGGGYWSPFPLPTSLADRGRVYAVSGYRDLLYTWGVTPLESVMAARNYPAQKYRRRESLGGHELLAWHYDDAWAWLDRGEKPSDGPLPSGWTAAPLGTDATVLASTQGTAWTGVGYGQAWSLGASATSALPPFPGNAIATGVCLTPSGTRIVALGSKVARLAVGATAWTIVTLPVEPSVGEAFITDVLCLPSGAIVGAGISGVRSTDDGLTFGAVTIGYPGAGVAQVHRLHRTAQGTLIAVGDWYAGRSTDDGQTFTFVKEFGRLFAVTSVGQTVWAAGSDGALIMSIDDGVTFTSQFTANVDVYDLAALDSQRLVGVGAKGAMVQSKNGGSSWSKVDTGLDRMLSGVRPLDGGVLVHGEGGFGARVPVP